MEAEGERELRKGGRSEPGSMSLKKPSAFCARVSLTTARPNAQGHSGGQEDHHEVDFGYQTPSLDRLPSQNHSEEEV